LSIICPLLHIYYYILFARVILSWVPVSPGGFLAQLNSVLYALTEPLLAPLRRAIRPVRIGGMGLDLSALIAFFGLILFTAAIGC
jgi:YggT family protein